MNIELYETMGWAGAIRAMRMPRRSWEKSDSFFWHEDNDKIPDFEVYSKPDFDLTTIVLGPNDLKLACKLIKAGGHHRVFMRHIFVQMEVNATHKWWSHFSKYDHEEDVSTSTSWDIKHHVDFEFSARTPKRQIEVFEDTKCDYYEGLDNGGNASDLLESAEDAVPKGSLQLRFVSTNYECIYTMYQQRRRHHNIEWREFCAWIETLPYMKEFLTT